ncbi:MAG: transglycosylase domain-containing protein, partial [Clostridia bacterium]|nr:transglycosylase domain-containing protein [Clostridia bacterium]
SRFYFQKSVEELSVPECAVLAGLVKSPNNYSPFKHPEKCLSRRNLVLGFMRQEGYIDESTYQAAINTPLPEKHHVDGAEASYCQFVYGEAERILEEKGIEMGGQLHVYTYLNRDLQRHLVETLKSASTNKCGGVLDNKTGNFIAYYSDVGNIARTPASTLKPLAVYAPAIEENIISLATPILDEPVNFSGYSPQNYDRRYHGYVSVREAIKKSYNVPAVKTLNALTVEKAKKYLEKMNLPLGEQDQHLAIALGATAEGYPLQRLLSAYATFANGGNYQKGAFIERIEREGETLYQRERQTTKVFEETTANLITDALKDAAASGTAKKLRVLPFQVAAKTGTSGASDLVRDAYTISFTSGLTCGVWLGKASNEAIPYTGGGLPCEISSSVYEYLYENFPPEYFTDFSYSKDVGIVKLDKYSYEKDGSLLLCDPLAPNEYVFEELLKNHSTPTKRSTIFSNPRIPAPYLSYKDLQATIIFDESSPKFYHYKIEKTVDKKTSVVYEGEYMPSFTDDNLQKNKTYIYTITPYFNNVKGIPCILPSINTKSFTTNGDSPSKITKKPWWEY